MHPHHKRALRIARRNYAFCKGVVERKHEGYLNARYRYIRAIRISDGKHAWDNLMEHKRALERSLEELQNQLSVVVTVERMLEKA